MIKDLIPKVFKNVFKFCSSDIFRVADCQSIGCTAFQYMHLQ